ncbi:unnamed protein product [Paramecium octaurelia]|uniref:Uncharacterized protein n=1 Tax=Paramecium octaurelia TaxID=43137 RepID=A0A8S1WXT6_PAROT|nr:unnamed protein product [Paramecium octaurelia]
MFNMQIQSTITRTPKIKHITELGSQLTINIILLVYYVSLDESHNPNSTNYKYLQIAGNLFQMIGHLLIISSLFKYLPCVILGIVAIVNFGVLSLLVGLGLVAGYYDLQNEYFKCAICCWFIQLAISILGMLVLLKICQENSKKEDVKMKSHHDFDVNDDSKSQIHI